MAEIYWTSLAKRHLQEIDAYIAEGTPFYSIIFIDKLIASAEKIGQFPEIGRIVPESDITDIREIFFHKYRIVYQVKPDRIFILAIVHGAMDITKKKEKESWDIE